MIYSLFYPECFGLFLLSHSIPLKMISKIYEAIFSLSSRNSIKSKQVVGKYLLKVWGNAAFLIFMNEVGRYSIWLFHKWNILPTLIINRLVVGTWGIFAGIDYWSFRTLRPRMATHGRKLQYCSSDWFLLLTPNNQLLIITGRLCQETARKKGKWKMFLVNVNTMMISAINIAIGSIAILMAG